MATLAAASPRAAASTISRRPSCSPSASPFKSSAISASGSAASKREPERNGEQPGFGPVAANQRAPHRRKCGRKTRITGARDSPLGRVGRRFSRGHRARLPPRLRCRNATPAGRTSCGSDREAAINSAWLPELDHAAVFEHADAVGLTHGREAVRDQDRGGVAGRGEDPGEDLGFAPHVELCGRLVEQHEARALLDGAERARQRDALPLATRQIGAARIAARQHLSRSARCSAPASTRASRITSSGAPPGATLSRSDSSKRMKSWNTAVSRARQPSMSRSRRSTPSISMAPRCGS